jgi:hypothetical protein
MAQDAQSPAHGGPADLLLQSLMVLAVVVAAVSRAVDARRVQLDGA